jgi:hypothetical protein
VDSPGAVGRESALIDRGAAAKARTAASSYVVIRPRTPDPAAPVRSSRRARSLDIPTGRRISAAARSLIDIR